MIKITTLFITVLLAVTVFQARAQSTATTSNPYSQFGLGEIDNFALPQTIGMGGLGAAINNFSGFYNLNPVNPASYGSLRLTVIDIGIEGSDQTFSQTGQASQSNGNFKLSHVAFAFPVTKHSALSFGLQPYSEVGYNYITSKKNLGTGLAVDTSAVNYIYSGQGGLSKAYFGYGFNIGKHLLIGANVSYIFGNIHQYRSTEIPTLFNTIDSRVEDSYAIGGLNYDYGAQYTIDVSDTKHFILGYSGSANNSINSKHTNLVSQYTYDSNGNQNVAFDTLSTTTDPKTKIKLPQINRYGLTFVSDNRYLIGAEYSTGNWSQLTIGGVNQGLQNSKTYNLGGQITPDANALSSYWKTVDYRLGFIYNQTYVTIINPNSSTTNITNEAVTFGLGLPLRPSLGGLSFYKINFAVEVGKEGTLANSLVKEKYINFHLSFSLNDTWFRQYKLQ
ncbi:hypothetical protein [Mucilaginibacter sp.]